MRAQAAPPTRGASAFMISARVMVKHSEANRIATVAGPVGELLVVARGGDLLVDKQVLDELDPLSDVHARDSEYTSTVDGRIVRAYFSLQLRIEKLVGRFQLVR